MPGRDFLEPHQLAFGTLLLKHDRSGQVGRGEVVDAERTLEHRQQAMIGAAWFVADTHAAGHRGGDDHERVVTGWREDHRSGPASLAPASHRLARRARSLRHRLACKPNCHHVIHGGSAMIALVAKYYVKPGQVDGVVSALQRMAPMVKEQEPGCTTYKASRSTDDPNLIMLYEEYRDQAALENHRTTPHFRDIIEGTVVPLLERRDRELYDVLIG